MPQLSFCQDLPSEERQGQHFCHPTPLPGSRVAACAEELKRALLAPDGRSYNASSQANEEKGMRKRLTKLMKKKE